jgi:hypothetical protein
MTLENAALMEITAELSIAELQLRKAAIEDRIGEVTLRRLLIAQRLEVAAVAPTAVPPAEREALRDERRALDAELDELLAGHAAVNRLTAARNRNRAATA